MSLLRAMMATAPAGPPPVTGGEHLYWRVFITAAQSGSFVSVAEIEMRGTPGGADLCSGGTATASTEYSTPTYQAANLFDNDNATVWANNGDIPSAWVRYEFATPTAITEVAIRSTPDSYNGGSHNEDIKNFRVEYSDDGTTWTVAYVSATQAAWTSGLQRVFGPFTGVGAPPNAYSGLTYWFQPEGSPIYAGSAAPLSLTTADGARPTRIDSAHSIARSLGASSAEIGTLKNPIVGSARGIEVGTGDNGVSFGARPSGGNLVSVLHAVSNYLSAANKAIIFAVKVDSAPVDAGDAYYNSGLFDDTYNGYCGLKFYQQGTDVVFEAYNWGGSQQKIAAPAVPLGAWVVVTMKHAGGQLRVKTNNNSWSSIASGNTSDLTLAATFANNGAGSRAFSVGDFCTYNANRSDAELLEVARYIGAKVGVSF